jgi:hypothetical protein
MPVFQSVAEFDLSVKYRLKAVGCEQQAELASNRTAERDWRQLAAQWLSMADLSRKDGRATPCSAPLWTTRFI